MTVKIKCIKELITDNTKYIPYCESEEEIAYLLTFPELKLFTEGKIYEVQISDGEWRVKDDTCGDTPYNHIVFNKRNEETNKWFYEHFEIIN